jgi:signal transduction histidine kinase
VRVGFAKAADRMHLNLKTKFALLTGVMVLAVGVILTTFLTRQQENTIRDELLNRAVALTEQLAYNCQLPLAAENKPSLRRLAQGLFKQAEVSYVQFLASDSTEMFRQGDGPGFPLQVADTTDVREQETGTQSGWIRTTDGSTFLDVRTPVIVEGSEDGDILATGRRSENVFLGTVRVGLSTAPAQTLIAHVRFLGGLLGLAIAVAGALIAALLVHIMTRPLSQLMEGNRRVARGDFSLRLEVRTGDEFGRLAGSYNQMADEIQRSRELAESYLASLRSNAEHLEGANRALQQSNAELAKASRMKSEFLAVMSHELRTPLNVIIGFSEVLLDQTFGDLNAKQKRYAENILSSGRHLLVLINDILDLSKVEAGRMKVAPEPFDLRQCVDEIQSLVRNLATRKGVDVHCAPVATLTPITDQKIFKQVMLNLLSNAIKFTPSGGRVDLEVRSLDGRVLRSDPSSRSLAPERRLGIVPRRVLLVEVRDTGIGIATDDHEKIFQAFQQVDASYARRQEGTGLGLALTRKLVRLLGGDVWFTSVERQGSTFWFYVPFEFSEGEGTGTERAELVPSDLSSEAAASESVTAATATREIDFTPAEPDVAAVAFEAGAIETLASATWPWGGEGAEAAAQTQAVVRTIEISQPPVILSAEIAEPQQASDPAADPHAAEFETPRVSAPVPLTPRPSVPAPATPPEVPVAVGTAADPRARKSRSVKPPKPDTGRDPGVKS